MPFREDSSVAHEVRVNVAIIICYQAISSQKCAKKCKIRLTHESHDETVELKTLVPFQSTITRDTVRFNYGSTN